MMNTPEMDKIPIDFGGIDVETAVQNGIRNKLIISYNPNLEKALQHFAEAAARATQAMDGFITAYFQHSAYCPYTRRQIVEAELGYRVPDWVWNVWEYQRETFGSGNGRVE